MDRNEYEETKFVKEFTNIINKSKCESGIETGMLVCKLSDLCCDFKTSSSIFKLLLKTLEEVPCDLNFLDFLDQFLDVCESHLSRWVTPDGGTDTVGLFLEFKCAVKDIMEEKGLRTLRSIRTLLSDRYPVNQNLYRGRTVNIPLLLRYGLGLKFTANFYELLQHMVVYDMVPFRQRIAFFDKMAQLPNKKRGFLVLLVILTFNNAEKFNSMTDASRALRTIWRSIPDSNLCRREIKEIFEGVAVYSNTLQKRIEQYEKFVCEDDFSELPQPRSLEHHSRCRVRQSLGLRRLLPTGVDVLPVPMKIKNYLLLE